jgi:hypothetical protein
MKNQDDSRKSQIKSILATNFKEKGRDSKRISWGESKVMQYQKGTNTAIIEEVNESMQTVNYQPPLNNGPNEVKKNEINNNKPNNYLDYTYPTGQQDLNKYIGNDKQYITETNLTNKAAVKEKSLGMDQLKDLISKKKDTNLIGKPQEDSAIKPPRLTLNLNEILNKSDQSFSSKEKEEIIKKKKTNRLTINLKETLELLNNDDSSDGSTDHYKYDPKNFFNTSSKRIQSSSKISLSPIMMDKEKLIYDVCNSSATKKLEYGDKLMNNIQTDEEDIKINTKEDKVEIINNKSNNNNNNDKLIINNKDIEEIKAEMPRKTILYKDNFSEIMEVDEGNYSKASEDTPEFPNVTQSINKESMKLNRETIDLNQAIQIQKNVLDSENNSIISGNLTPSLKNNLLFSSFKKNKNIDDVSNKYNNLNKQPLPQTLNKLFSPLKNNINSDANNTNQIVSPIRDKKSFNYESIIKEKDVKMRINSLLKIMEGINLNKEKELSENNEQIIVLTENAKELNKRKESYLKEKADLELKLEEIIQKENSLREKIDIYSTIAQTTGFSVLNTENNTLRIQILKYITIEFVFKTFTRKLCLNHDYSFEMKKANFSFNDSVIKGMKNDIKKEIFNLYDDLIHFVLNLNKNSESSIKINFAGLVDLVKKLIKYSSFIIYLSKCLSIACVVSESATLTLKKQNSIVNTIGNLKLNFINTQGIMVGFNLEIEIFNCFYGIKLTDVPMENISHQKMNDQELHKLMNLINDVKNYLNNNHKHIFRLRDFINNIPNYLYK